MIEGLSQGPVIRAEEPGKPKKPRQGPVVLWTLAVGLTLTLLAVPVQVPAAGLRHLADGWLLPGQVQMQVVGRHLRDREKAGISIWLMAGSCRLFGMEELPVRELSGGIWSPLGGRQLQLSGSWEATGAELLAENWVQGRLGWGHLALWYRRWTLALAGQKLEPAGCWGWDAGGNLWEQGSSRIAGRIWWNLSRSPAWFGPQGRRRLACLWAVMQGWSLGLDLDRTSSGDPGLTLDALLQVAPAVGMGLRSDPVSGAHGPTLVCSFGSFLLRTCHLAHPDLGVTHRFSLVWGEPAPGGP